MKKDKAIESDSKQRMMSWWNRTESGSTDTNLEIETPLSQIQKIFSTLYLQRDTIAFVLYVSIHVLYNSSYKTLLIMSIGTTMVFASLKINTRQFRVDTDLPYYGSVNYCTLLPSVFTEHMTKTCHLSLFMEKLKMIAFTVIKYGVQLRRCVMLT